MGKATTATIVILSLALAGTLFYSLRSQIQMPDSVNSVVSSIDEQVKSAPKVSTEPVTTYTNCKAYVRADNGWIGQSIEDTCYDSAGHQHVIKLAIPDPLKDTNYVCIQCKSNVAVYGDGHYQVSLFDAAGEKKYTTKLWELPN